jgi:hypothetical protein
MPPVSVTMQPSNLPADGAREPDVGDGALGDDGPPDEDGLAVVADPHAVANSAMTPSATACLIVVRTGRLFPRDRPWKPQAAQIAADVAEPRHGGQGLDSATAGLDCGFLLPRRRRRDYPSGNPGAIRDDSPAAGALPGKILAVPRAA